MKPLAKVDVLLTTVGHTAPRMGGVRYYAGFQHAGSSDNFEITISKAEHDRLYALSIDGSLNGVFLEMTIYPKTAGDA